MPPAPRLQLTSAFRTAIKNDPRGVVRLATLANYPAYPLLGRVINPPRFSGTPLNLSRLRALAEVVGFTGDLWHQ